MDFIFTPPAANALGNADDTSARPPVLAYGSISLATKRTFVSFICVPPYIFYCSLKKILTHNAMSFNYNAILQIVLKFGKISEDNYISRLSVLRHNPRIRNIRSFCDRLFEKPLRHFVPPPRPASPERGGGAKHRRGWGGFRSRGLLFLSLSCKGRCPVGTEGFTYLSFILLCTVCLVFISLYF